MRKYTLNLLLLIAISPLTLFISCTEAFGPKSKMVTINLSDDKILLCNETYNADIHSVSYYVDFKLIDKKSDTVHLGRGSFSDQNWRNSLRLSRIGNFYLLPVKEYSYLKLLFTTFDNHKKVDTTLSPQNLRYDVIWKSQTNDIPAWTYYGSSNLDIIYNNKIVVTYEYRIGLYKPFKFYSQNIEYEIDTLNGILLTKKIFIRKEK